MTTRRQNACLRDILRCCSAKSDFFFLPTTRDVNHRCSIIRRAKPQLFYSRKKKYALYTAPYIATEVWVVRRGVYNPRRAFVLAKWLEPTLLLLRWATIVIITFFLLFTSVSLNNSILILLFQYHYQKYNIFFML